MFGTIELKKIIVRDMLHNIREVTFQDIAQPIQCTGSDPLVVPEPEKLGFADVIGLMERFI